MTQWSELRLHDGGPCPVGEDELTRAFYDDGFSSWFPVMASRRIWSAVIAYQVAIPESRDMQVPWHVLPKEYRFTVENRLGSAYVHKEPPEPDQRLGFWVGQSDSIRIDQLVGYDPGTKPWDQSLIQRPEGL